MSTLDVHSSSGDVLREKQLVGAFTDVEVNGPVIHQCVVAYLANQRQGSASTKTRSDVKGSGRKLYRQREPVEPESDTLNPQFESMVVWHLDRNPAATGSIPQTGSQAWTP